jgi:hypothetical protein
MTVTTVMDGTLVFKVQQQTSIHARAERGGAEDGDD